MFEVVSLIEENPNPKQEEFFLNKDMDIRFNNLVVKIGGSTLGSGDTTFHDLVALQDEGVNPIVVHGGGKLIDKWLGQLGVRPKFVDGLRVTDSDTLEVVIAILTGVVNTSIVSAINQLGGKAVGVSGVDGNIIVGKIDRPELGLVAGEVNVNAEMLKTLIDSGIIPVIAPIATNLNDKEQPCLNANADTVAGAVAIAMQSKKLIFMTDVEGVYDSSRRLIKKITYNQLNKLIESNVIHGGMIPKLNACLKVVDNLCAAHIIDGRGSNALKDCLAKTLIGTSIVKK
ncbi:MAG: acetylglutamate kinase [SAR202 cluster bacterium]|nr:acetylglutamate kinase [SAR202 cluster bacterium]|tara:strand:- start:10222 stop:11079 length:858 start_codon:yes stop_codon:yes gene_type:complete